METGYRGTFVISWSQTEVDGLEGAPVHALGVGAAWSWRGEPLRVDGAGTLLELGGAAGTSDLRKRAARMVRKLVGAALEETTDVKSVDVSHPLHDRTFVVTDGVQSFTVSLIDVGPGSPPLLMFLNAMPPRETDLWVVHHSLSFGSEESTLDAAGGVICFTPGTRIETPHGPCAVEDLREGDRVLTKDSGPQEILWIGQRRMTGARLFAMPALRPIRIRAGALGIERPEQELLVSPAHRMLIQGPTARALFNTPEVLVSARDLVNGSTIAVDLALREVTYVHLLLPSHQIVWANGIETESFHPANAALTTLSAADRTRLLARFPRLEDDPHGYGGYARRNLSSSEAAILRHEAA